MDAELEVSSGTYIRALARDLGSAAGSGAHLVALRRSGSTGTQEPSSFEAGDFRVDMDARRVHTQGREVRLTPKEFDLFVYMAKHPNRVLTHAALLEAVWGQASQEQPEYLRVFMGQLRKKLEPGGVRIVTVRGLGYSLEKAPA